MTDEAPKAPEPLFGQHIGRLEYLGWDRPWLIGSTDLRRDFWRAALRWRNKPTSQNYDRQHYQLSPAAESRYVLRWEKIGGGVILSARDRMGFTNVGAHLEDAMMRLNARRVIADISEQAFLLRADPSDEVFGVKYLEAGNSARIPAGAEQSVCRVGAGADCCIFLACGPGGFTCEKFSGPTARHLIARRAEGTIRAQRIGDCACRGREGIKARG